MVMITLVKAWRIILLIYDQVIDPNEEILQYYEGNVKVYTQAVSFSCMQQLVGVMILSVIYAKFTSKV